MKFRLACALLLTSLVACGGDDDNGKPVDAAVAVPQMINISGKTQSTGIQTKAVGGIDVGVYKVGDDATPLATVTSDQDGNFSMSVPTGGVAIDGYLKASNVDFVTTYLYPPFKITADYSGASLNLVVTTTVQTLTSLCGIDNFDITMKGVIGVQVVDATGALVSGAAVTSTPAPAKICYNKDASPLPDPNGTVTTSDGLAYLIDISGDVTVTASKSGSTFGMVKVNERLSSLTTTQLVAQ